jgi:hypothetical protein
MKISAMHHSVWRAEPLHRGFAKVEGRPALPGAAQPDLLAGGGTNHLPHRRFQAERYEDACAVGPELQAGADFPQFGGLLEHAHGVSTLDQWQSRGQPAKTSPYDKNIGHSCLLVPPSCLGHT